MQLSQLRFIWLPILSQFSNSQESMGEKSYRHQTNMVSDMQLQYTQTKDLLGENFFISGSRESLPYFSKNPNKNKSAFAEFYFYFPLLLHYFVKNEIKMTFEMKKTHTHTQKKANCKMLLCAKSLVY